MSALDLQARVAMAEQDVERLARDSGRNPWRRDALRAAQARLGQLRLALKEAK